ncbi:uncharacterized protein LOC144349428 [Saccoglossus kowalevskii]
MADSQMPFRDKRAVLQKPPSGRVHFSINPAIHHHAREPNITSSQHLLFDPCASQAVKYPHRTRPLSAKASLGSVKTSSSLPELNTDYVQYQRQRILTRSQQQQTNAELHAVGVNKKKIFWNREGSTEVPSTSSKHLLFEPVSRQISASSNSHDNQRKKRPQSAKARLEHNDKPSNARVQNNRNINFNVIHQPGHSNGVRRPQSAKVKETTSLISLRKRPTSAKARLDSGVSKEPLKTKTLELETHVVPKEKSRSVEDEKGLEFPYKLVDKKDAVVIPTEEVKCNQKRKDIPKGISMLAPYLTENIPPEWCGVDPASCLVFLPSLLCYIDDDLPLVPPIQQSSDTIPYSSVQEPTKPYDPKKLFHYTMNKNKGEDESVLCDDVNIYSKDGTLLHDHSKYNGRRTRDVIEQEIEDLEQLLQGIGRAESDNIIVQYQYDINLLQREVRKTLRQTRHIRSPEDPPDLFGLKEFCKEHDKIIARIKHQRELCVQELSEIEAELGMQMQHDIMKEYKKV